jgi:hypothetical protein
MAWAIPWSLKMSGEPESLTYTVISPNSPNAPGVFPDNPYRLSTDELLELVRCGWHTPSTWTRSEWWQLARVLAAKIADLQTTLK